MIKQEELSPSQNPNPTIFQIQTVKRNLSIQTKSEKRKYPRTGRWTPEEHLQFVNGFSIIYSQIIGLQNYGRNWSTIQKLIPTRTASQIRTHAQKFFQRLGEESKKTDILAYIRSKPASYFVDNDRPYCRLSAGKWSGEENSHNESSKKNIEVQKNEHSFCEFDIEHSVKRKITESNEGILLQSVEIQEKFQTNSSESKHLLNIPQSAFSAVSHNNKLSEKQFQEKVISIRDTYIQLNVLYQTIMTQWMTQQTLGFKDPLREKMLERSLFHANQLTQSCLNMLQILSIKNDGKENSNSSTC